MKKKYALLLALIGLGFGVANAQKGDWANFGRYESANVATLQLPKAERQVVFMGNSITEGWFAQDSMFFKNNHYVNRGISGQTTSQMLVRFRRDVVDLAPKVVVILAGTNDIAGNTGDISLDNIKSNLVSMVEIAKAHNIKTILCSVLPAFDYPWSPGKQPNEKIPALNKMLQDYAKKNNVTYLDYYTAMKDSRNGLPESLSKDGVHPNLKGDQIMEGLVQKAIKRAL